LLSEHLFNSLFVGYHPRVAGIEVTVLAKNNFKQQSATRPCGNFDRNGTFSVNPQPPTTFRRQGRFRLLTNVDQHNPSELRYCFRGESENLVNSSQPGVLSRQRELPKNAKESQNLMHPFGKGPIEPAATVGLVAL
jgi:hypothetical protein